MTTSIAIDIDDTLYPFGMLAREQFVQMAVEKGDKRLQRGAYCAWGEWRSPSDVIDPEYWGEIIDRCHQPENIVSQIPFPHAVDTIHRLAHDGYRLIFISNRKPAVYDATYQWLQDSGFPVRDNELICTMSDKMKHLRNCQYIIDDRPKTLVQFVYDFDWKNKWGSKNPEKTRKGFGIFGEYNRALTDIPGIYLAPNWLLLREYLMEKGVLS